MLPDWFNQLGVMQWPLALCAIVALAICLERLVFFTKSRAKRVQQLQVLVSQLDAQQHQAKPIRDELVNVMLSELQPRYYQGLKLLRMIGTMAPMLGLLGTILGIIEAFKAIAAQTGPVSANLIAGGLWEAMLTTATGLLIALPILFLAYFFRYLAEKQLGQYALYLNKHSMQMALNSDSKRVDMHQQDLPRQIA